MVKSIDALYKVIVIPNAVDRTSALKALDDFDGMAEKER